MPRSLHLLLEGLGQAFCEKGRRALQGYVPFGDVLTCVAERTLVDLRQHMPSEDIRFALGKAAAAEPAAYRTALDTILEHLCSTQSVPFRNELDDYLTHLPLTVRQVFRRPSDPLGLSPPAKLDFYKAEQLLPYLPPRRPRFKVGDRPDGLDHWELTELRGLGECGEVWLGNDEDQPDHSPAALKFAIDKESQERILANRLLFEMAFELNDIPGVVPLRSVYLETDPPCLESAFVTGYDLNGLMHEWRWVYDAPKPAAALKLIRRLAEILGEAHDRGVVHRDIKPSNVIVHTSDRGRLGLWITDFGWGQIEAVRSLELHRIGGTPKAEQMRLALRGAYTPLYASPQQTNDEAPAPTDDVHALGVLWYQLLKRDPHAEPPVGDNWAEEFYPHGFTPAQAKLLTACVAIRADRRPANGNELAAMLKGEAVTISTPPVDDDSREMPLTATVAALKAPLKAKGHVPMDAAAKATTAALSTAGGSRGHADPMAALNARTPISGTPATAPKMFRNFLGLAFARIPAGSFAMGAANDEPGSKTEESPQHRIHLTRYFYMSIFPVTQGQYEKLLGRNPAFFHRAADGGPDYPVEEVSWADAERFCLRLSHFGDEEKYGHRYRLPTEAEWEYACRAGTTTAFACGETLPSGAAHIALPTRGQGHSTTVGRHPANAWGLHDMHGTIGEWCHDWYDGQYYLDSPTNDPQGPTMGNLRVVRGGSWAATATDCRSAARAHQHPDRPTNTIGFRVVMTMEQ